MATGLDRTGRDVVRLLVEKRTPPEDVRRAIRRLEKSDGQLWSYGRNMLLVRELAERGYRQTSQFLADRINGNGTAGV